MARKLYFMIVLSIFLLAVPLVSSSEMNTSSYSVDSFHLGSSGNNGTTTNYNLRDTLTYEQGSNKDGSTANYTFNSGWFDIYITETPAPTPPGPIGPGPIYYLITPTPTTIVPPTTTPAPTTIVPPTTTPAPTTIVPPTTTTAPPATLALKPEAPTPTERPVPRQLFDIKLEIDDATIQSSDELSAIVVFESFGFDPTPVDLTFIILDEAGEEVYREKDNITVTTEEVVRKQFKGLNLEKGKYTLLLHTVYSVNIFDEFRQDFEIGEEKEGITRRIMDWIKGPGKRYWLMIINKTLRSPLYLFILLGATILMGLLIIRVIMKKRSKRKRK